MAVLVRWEELLMKCECKKHEAFYLMDSWAKNELPRKLCCVCVDKMLVKARHRIIKDVLNLRKISGKPLNE